MAEKRSVYLSEIALSLPRRRDSLSGRLNQVAARYAELISQHGPTVRARFNAAEWGAILDACDEYPVTDTGLDYRLTGKTRDKVRELSAADRLALLEMIEAEM